MRSGRVEPELHALRKRAEELSQQRRERPTSVHLLAALAESNAPTAALLNERRLSSEEILNKGQGLTDDVNEAARALLQRAHDLAVRMGLSQAQPVHVLLAVLNEPRCAARKLLDSAGVEVSRLRALAMQVGLGLLRERRKAPRPAVLARVVPAREAQLVATSTPSPSASVTPTIRGVTPRPSASGSKLSGRRLRPGVTVPFVPQPKAPPREPEKVPSDAKSVAASEKPVKEAKEKAIHEPATATASAATNEASNAGEAGAVGSNPSSPRSVTPARPNRFDLDPQRFPTLTGLGKNLTALALRGELDPAVGRLHALEQTLDVLAKREGNNPCLVGPAGVGKTSIVRALAQRIASKEAVVSLDDRIVIEISVSELFAGTGVRGALSGRLIALRREIALARGRVVLFFDELHQLFAGDASDEIGSELKLALARGELPCIGATTLEEYQKYIAPDAALARRFTLVDVEEPTREEAYLILDALKPKLEAHHRVRYRAQALALGVAWTVRYMPSRFLPDKAVSVLDLAGARTRRRGKLEVSEEAVAEVVSELCDMPIERLLEADGERFLRLPELLAERVVGHRQQMERIARILRRNAAGLGSRRPLGTFLLLGPSGVGKTETAKALAEVLFHSEAAMTRLDLSEYSEAHAVARLIGAPPGYVGHEAGGQLTEAVRRRPYQVLLLDELEKAHPDVLTAFLAVFDEGRMTDGRGRIVDFTNTVILMTSNLGAREVTEGRRRVGFGSGEVEDTSLESRIISRARASLSPELYNRIDEALVFAPLGREEISEVIRRLLSSLAARLGAERGLKLQFSSQVIEYLLSHGGFEPELGARPAKRAVARYVEAPLAERILSGNLEPGAGLLIQVTDGEIVIGLTPPPPVSRRASSLPA